MRGRGTRALSSGDLAPGLDWAIARHAKMAIPLLPPPAEVPEGVPDQPADSVVAYSTRARAVEVEQNQATRRRHSHRLPRLSRRRPCRARPGHALKTCTRPRTTNGSTTCTLRSARCAAYVRAPCVAEHRELSGTRAQVTTDIYDDAERQHLTLDDTVRFCAIPRHGCAC
jgi:hypothetical protein